MKLKNNIKFKYNKTGSIVISTILLGAIAFGGPVVSDKLNEQKVHNFTSDYNLFRMAVDEYYHENLKMPESNLQIMDTLSEIPDVPPISTKDGAYAIVNNGETVMLEVSNVVLKDGQLEEIVESIGQENVSITKDGSLMLNLLK